MVDDVTIRIAVAEDIPQLIPLIEELVQLYGEPSTPDRERLAEILHQLIDDPNCEYIVGEVGGRIIGCVQVNYRLSTWEAAPYAYLEDFIVQEEARGFGVGSTLMAYARDRARRRGCVRIDLDVRCDDVRVWRFYHRWGFKKLDRDLLRLSLRNNDHAR